MVKTRVTLRDVARRVGVHPSTVSRVLNPHTRPMVTQAIARRILAAAEALGYHPNPIAYGLKTNRSLIVGVLIPDLTNPVFPPILRGIEDVLTAAGYTAILANTDNDETRERTILGKMLARRVDGLILATARRRDSVVEQCCAEDIPLVLMNRTVDDGSVSAVVNDDEAGIRQVVDHLAAQGHRMIAHIAGPLGLSTGFMRRKAFVAAMKAHGLRPDPLLIIAANAFSEAEGRRAFLELRGRGRPFSAVVTANDLLALGCYDACLELGLRIPEDVSVSGYNDMPYVDKLRPPLSTVRIPHYEMGAQAAQALLQRIENPATPAKTVRLKPEFIARGSMASAQPRRKMARAASAPA